MAMPQFSTEAYPHCDRDLAWREHLAAAGLHLEAVHADKSLHGTIQTRTTQAGMEFCHIASIAQTCRTIPGEERGLLAILFTEGEATARVDELTQRVHRRQILLACPNAGVVLSTSSAFRMLMLHIGPALLAARVSAPLPGEKIVQLSGESGALFAGLLTAISENFDEVASSDRKVLQPFENAIFEFLTTVLIDNQPRALPGMTRSRASIYARICDRIVARLAEPDLSLATIAADEHVSTRYLQKLFERSGASFSAYLRTSRLDRCRSDLANPLYKKLSVADICYRWGFSDPSYFSHAFRDQFGLSPRTYRDQMASVPVAREVLKISRGLPDDARQAPWQRVDPNNASGVGQTTLGQTQAEAKTPAAVHSGAQRHWLRVSDKTIHWGYFSHDLPPVLQVRSGDQVTVETLTQHAGDDWDRMVRGDPGAESVFHWTQTQKNVNRRGAGPIDASVYGRGAGEGFGVHICTGPIAIEQAMPGDVLEVRILDVHFRPSRFPGAFGKAYGSNAATWWGFHYRDLLTEPRERETVTIFEIDCETVNGKARALYNFRWTPQRDPFGVTHRTIDYPGVPVDHSTVVHNAEALAGVEIPLRPHFGVIAVAPAQDGLIDSIPPSSFAGNLDNWRITKGARIFLRVMAPGALFSIGDPHASQGDSELCGTAIECSLTGDLQLVLHKAAQIEVHAPYADLTYPLVETASEWIIHGFSLPNHLVELGQAAQSKIYQKSTLDEAMRDAFRKVRRFLMSVHDLTEDEAVTLISVAVDFGVTQVVNGNWGVHAIVRKSLFEKRKPTGHA